MADSNSPGIPDSHRPYDVLAVEFPTDSITVKDLIRQFPQTFRWDVDPQRSAARPSFDPEENHLAFQELRAAILIERELAELAFVSASQPRQGPSRMQNFHESADMSRGDLVRSLDQHYRTLGLSSGAQQTLELVRRFESQAAKQAPGIRK